MRYIARMLLLLVTLLIVAELNAQKKEVVIRKGDVITQSVKVKRGTYYLLNNDSLAPALIIEGDNITIDFNGAVIKGSKDIRQPDRFTGIAILIRKGSNVIIKNVTVNGFKVGIMAEQADGLQIVNSNLSYNYRQHLNSNRFREDLSDWQSYHTNNKDEWLRFGAGIYLKSCNNVQIYNNVITDGQCALMMTNCHGGSIYNNNFSFNSGVGIGMYRSNRNNILHNKVDWNVRGYSYGYYYRGQDSGGMLVFDQCSDNVFANNSVTHSGDGFFLWAGNETIETGKGGCNDNLIYGNDFSYAPTNAVEITFSRNKVIKNKLHGSWHGIWGGFSYNTVIVKNDFGGNLAGISIEHGQDNIIEQNTFTADSLGIELWAIPNRRTDFGLMKMKDTRSRDYSIMHNVFDKVPTVYSIKNTQSVTMAGNRHSGYRTLQKTDSLVKGLKYIDQAVMYDYRKDSVYVSSLLRGIKKQYAILPPDHPQGKKSIMMTEWGPYNFRYPILWWTKNDSSGKMHFEVTGPPGKWKVKNLQGVKMLSASEGSLPGILEVQKETGAGNGISVELEYTGKKLVSPFGEITPAGKSYSFGYTENNLPMSWDVRWFAFDSLSDPVKQHTGFLRLLEAGEPVKSETVNADSYRHLHGKGMPSSRFATLVNTEVRAPGGNYKIAVTAGEIVRVYVDDKLVIDAWDPSAVVFDADYHKEAIVPLNGRHRIRIVQAQYGGYGMLSCFIKPVE